VYVGTILLVLVFFSQQFWKQFELSITENWFQISAKSTAVEFVLFQWNIIKNSRIFPLLFVRIVYCLPSNSPSYKSNEISYLWRLNISSSRWTPMTKSSFLTRCGHLEFKVLWWKKWIWVWSCKEDKEDFEFDWGIRVKEAGISLSADSDCNEKRAAATGQRIVRLLAFLVWEDSEEKGEIIIDWFFHDIFSDIYEFSVVKQTNFFLIPCPFVHALFWFQQIFSEQPDAIFNSVLILRPNSRPSQLDP
jgi:hypothetical protein